MFKKRKKPDKESVIKAFNWAYDKAVIGVTGSHSAVKLAEGFMNKKGSLSENVDSLIKVQVLKCGTSGFLSGLGGLSTMAFALPASIMAAMYFHIRMIAAIAHMGGHNIYDERVRTLIFICLCGNVAKDIMEDVGIRLGAALSQETLKQLTTHIIIHIHQVVSTRLLARFVEKGGVLLGRGIPLLGGVIGGATDSFATFTIGKVAKKMFIEEPAL